jgi:hypothetical protein
MLAVLGVRLRFDAHFLSKLHHSVKVLIPICIQSTTLT